MPNFQPPPRELLRFRLIPSDLISTEQVDLDVTTRNRHGSSQVVVGTLRRKKNTWCRRVARLYAGCLCFFDDASRVQPSRRFGGNRWNIKPAVPYCISFDRAK